MKFQPETTLGHECIEQKAKDNQADANWNPAVLVAADSPSQQHEHSQHQDHDSKSHDRCIWGILQVLLHSHDVTEGKDEDPDAKPRMRQDQAGVVDTGRGKILEIQDRGYRGGGNPADEGPPRPSAVVEEHKSHWPDEQSLQGGVATNDGHESSDNEGGPRQPVP